DAARARAAEPQPDFLYCVVRFVQRSEHPVCHSLQVASILFESLCQPVLFVHRSHSSTTSRHCDDGPGRTDVTSGRPDSRFEEPARSTGRKKEFMNLYSLVVFSHIVATLGLFAGLTIEWVTVSALKRANPAETRIWINLWPRLLPLTILSAVLLLASGIYL